MQLMHIIQLIFYNATFQHNLSQISHVKAYQRPLTSFFGSKPERSFEGLLIVCMTIVGKCGELWQWSISLYHGKAPEFSKRASGGNRNCPIRSI